MYIYKNIYKKNTNKNKIILHILVFLVISQYTSVFLIKMKEIDQI